MFTLNQIAQVYHYLYVVYVNVQEFKSIMEATYIVMQINSNSYEINK